MSTLPQAVPGLDTNLHRDRVQEYIKDLPESSPLRKFIEEYVFRWKEGYDDNFFEMVEDSQSWPDHFKDDDEYDTYYEQIMEMERLLYSDCEFHRDPNDENCPMFEQLKILYEVICHSPMTLFRPHQENFPNFSFKEAKLIYLLTTVMWAHYVPEVE